MKTIKLCQYCKPIATLVLWACVSLLGSASAAVIASTDFEPKVNPGNLYRDGQCPVGLVLSAATRQFGTDNLAAGGDESCKKTEGADERAHQREGREGLGIDRTACYHSVDDHRSNTDNLCQDHCKGNGEEHAGYHIFLPDSLHITTSKNQHQFRYHFSASRRNESKEDLSR